MKSNSNKYLQMLLTLIIALLGGTIFVVIHAPIPWLLGPMISILIGSRVFHLRLIWPVSIRDSGLIIVGYSIGLSFTKETVFQIIQQLPSMLLFTTVLIVLCAVMAFFVSKWSGVNYPTILTGSIPGGLSQMISLAEEIKGIDITTVTFLQVARLLMIIFSVPFLVFSPLFHNDAINGTHPLVQNSHLSLTDSLPKFILFLMVSIIFALLGRKIKLPTPFLLGPIFGTALLNLSGFKGPALTPTILDLSQFMIGGYIGLLLKPEELNQKTKMISLSIFSGFMLILFSLGLSYILLKTHDITPSTSFLSLAPGGMDQMGIIAHEVNADISMVTGYHLFRLFFIYFLVPPLLKLFLKFYLKKMTS